MMTAATLFAGMSSAVLEGGIGASIQQQFNVGEPAAIFTGTIFVRPRLCPLSTHATLSNTQHSSLTSR